MADRPNLTPRTWPEMEEPTPEAWLGWFLQQDRAGQLYLATSALSNAREAHMCMVLGHDSLLAQVQAHRCITDDDLHQRVAEASRRATRYRNAWRSARRFRKIWRQQVAEVLGQL